MGMMTTLQRIQNKLFAPFIVETGAGCVNALADHKALTMPTVPPVLLS
jgi:hypothetical protein